MASADYVPPEHNKTAFHCPLCGVYAQQSFFKVASMARSTPGISIHGYPSGMETSFCAHCRQYAFWQDGNLVLPAFSIAPLASPDMPEDVAADFNEAREVLAASPRSSAALLRLVVQKLCLHLGEKGKKIDDDIRELVKKGLSPQIQKALDIVRIVGNNAVHPGELDVRDDPETALKLFGLVNLIVHEMITRPREIEALYATMPEGALNAIERRDGGNSTP